MALQPKKAKQQLTQITRRANSKADPRRQLTTLRKKSLNKLEAIADKLKRGENVQRG